MRIGVFGLGYVGAVSAACFAHLGHDVTGVDINPDKVDKLNRGESPVLEPGVPEMLRAALADKRIRATTDAHDAVRDSDVSLLCVGTPSLGNGNIDLSYLEAAVAEIGTALASSGTQGHVVIVRSTVLPGSTHHLAKILEANSGLTPSDGVTMAVNPEFLREGTGVADFVDPPFILIGSEDAATAAVLDEVYEGVDAKRFVEPIRVAEMVKYANNSFHAAKVTFANEIGAISRELGISGTRVMELLCKDDKLNMSPAYLRPGFAFGGSCLPKDVRALNYAAKSADVATPLLGSLLMSNSIQIERVVTEVVSRSGKRVGVLGLAFKAGTDDLRESPMVDVVERLLGKGFECQIHDPDVTTSNLTGQNREYIDHQIPHLAGYLLDDVRDVVQEASTVIVAKKVAGLDEALRLAPDDQLVVDLVGLADEHRRRPNYVGVGW